MEPLRLYTSRRRQILLLAGALAFTGFSIWLLIDGRPADETFFAVVAIVLFGLASVYLVVRLVKRRPALVVDVDGVTDTSSLAAAGRIAWAEIQGVRITRFGKQRMLAVDLFDADLVISRVPAARRRLLTANRGLTGAAVNIPEIALPLSLEDLVTEMTRRHPGLQIGPAG